MKRFIISILVLIVVLNSVTLSLFFLIHSHNNFEKMRNRQIDDVERELINRLESFNIIVKPFEKQAEQYNERALRESHQKVLEETGGTPSSVTNEMLEHISDEYDGFDLYYLDDKGFIRKSSFESDIGVNLFSLNEEFTDFLKSIYGSGKIYTQRLSISNMQGTKMVYSYFSPEGGNYILESSVSLKDYIEARYSDNLHTHLFHNFFTDIISGHSTIENLDILFTTDLKTRSLITGKEHPLDKPILEALKTSSTYRHQKEKTLRVYIKKSMKKSGFDFVQYPIIYLEYDLSSYYTFLFHFYLIAGLSIVLLIGLFSWIAYRLAERKLVRRVVELDDVLQKATEENYEQKVEFTSRIPELQNLADSANSLIEQVGSREEKLKLALEERETLLHEIHHRVKNNLNVVISLLNLQNEQVSDEEDVRDALLKTKNRIYSISLTHEKLYHSENLTDINMKYYLDSFLSGFNISMGNTTHIQFETDVDDTELAITYAVPCGIILNELLTNAVQHAFPGETEGRVKIIFRKVEENRYALTVEDNGIGLKEDFNLQEPSSLGFMLIDTLVKQIHGSFDFGSNTKIEGEEEHAEQRRRGARFEVTFDAI